MRKFPTSIYSGKPRGARRPVYNRPSMLCVVRGERKSNDLQQAIDRIQMDMLVYGTSITRIEPQQFYDG